MATKVYHEEDGNLSILKDKTIAIIGYGNQGRAQALNLRDSGLRVIIGNRDDDYKQRAERDGFPTYSISAAVKVADIIFLLIPDEIMHDVFNNNIRSNLEDKQALVFASGYTISFGLLEPPTNVDILLLAPRMIGVGVRESFLTNEGFFSFISVHQNVSGKAKDILLALCKGVGTLMKGAIEVTLKQEAVLDLFNEQGFGPAFGRVLLSCIYTLVDAGYPPEAVLVEMFMSGEMSYTYEKMAKVGLVKQTNFHSHTSQYGAMSRGIKFRNLPIKKPLKEILEDIESGNFARDWASNLAKLKFKIIKFFAMKTRINRIEQQVRKSLQLKEVNLFEEAPPPTQEDLKRVEEIKEALKEFEEFYREY